MGLLKQVVKGGVALSAGSAAGKVLALARNVIIARFISPEDFGIAATFIVTLTLLQSVSEVAADKLLIQAKDGDDESLQRAVHFFQIGRGVFSAAVLLALATPISLLFGAPETEWAFRTLAVIPLLRGFVHLDMRRVQRGMKFKPYIMVDLVSQAVAVAIAAPLAFWLEDYRAALWVLIIQTAAYTASTHVLAERTFRASFDRLYVKRLFLFGWPLMINGALMFIVAQGDRLVIGADISPYSLAELGVYSVAMTLVMAPRQMLTRVASSLMLPVLSRAQDDPPLFERRYAACLQGSAVVGTVVGVLLIIAGTFITIALFGEKYAGVSTFIGWLAAMQAIRIIRTTPATAGLARADSSQLMLTTLARTVSLLLLIGVAAAGLSLAWIAAAGFVGEVIALSVAIVLLARRHGLRPIVTLWPTLVAFLGLAGAAGLAELIKSQGDGLLSLAVALVACAAVGGAMVLAYGALRRLVLEKGVGAVLDVRRRAASQRNRAQA